MAYICTRPRGSCPTCPHYRPDPDYGYACWAAHDEARKSTGDHRILPGDVPGSSRGHNVPATKEANMAKKQNYTVTVDINFSVDVQVSAEDRDTAIEMAREKAETNFRTLPIYGVDSTASSVEPE
jgi:3,4-dihydroxy-2-butanone 4-phosphate synthase